MGKKKWICRVLAALLVLLAVIVALISGLRIYGKHELKKKIEVLAKEAPEKISWQGKDYVYRDDVVNIVCLGVDRQEDLTWDYGDGRSIGQADAIFVASIDLRTDAIRVIAVPRDTMVNLMKFTKEGEFEEMLPGQITLQYAYGKDGDWRSCSQMTHRVSECLGNIPIHGYVAMNLTSIAAINDAVGGVEITMDEDYTQINPAFEKGATLRLFGQDAVDFIQRRDTAVDGSALMRVSREKQYLKAFIRQAKSAVKKDPGLPFSLMEELQSNLTTDLPDKEIACLLAEAVFCDFSEDGMYVLPGEIRMGAVYEEYYLDMDAVMELVVDLFCEEQKVH